MIKMMILQCVWYDLLATKVLMLHNLAVLLYCGNSMVVVLSFRTRTAFLPTDCHSASPWLFLRWWSYCSLTFVVVVIYRPGGDVVTTQFYTKLTAVLEQLANYSCAALSSWSVTLTFTSMLSMIEIWDGSLNC